MSDGTPLPNALSGVIVQRLVEIDEALLYLVSGAISGMVLKEPLEQTGALTPETAQNALSVMLETYLTVRADMTPVGATMTWHMAVAPTGWIVCEGGAVNVADYPELFDLWGYKYGGSGAQFGIIDMRNLSPFGAEGGELDLDATAGAMTHTLTTPQIPLHNHRERVSTGANANIFTTAGGANSWVASGGATVGNAPINTGDAGGGLAHNNLHPVVGVKWIVYGGRA